ncbi:MAG: PAS domain-containing sensor histidine kinase, partial [Proteobacteria bacterium]|nr:PAS domain-containing sensor histidine kinase [Pseudomonadota bacterium]
MTSEESRMRREINQLKAKVSELTEIIDAMTTGSADALVVKHPCGSQIYTIEAAN